MTVEPRTVTAFIGPSGCGKSTLLRTLNRMHEVIPGAHVKGSIDLDGTDLYGAGVDPVAVRRVVGMVFQRPNPFPAMSIFDNVACGPAAQRGQEQDGPGRGGRALADRGQPVERGQGPARQGRASACPAVSSSGSASPGPSRSSRRCC